MASVASIKGKVKMAAPKESAQGDANGGKARARVPSRPAAKSAPPECISVDAETANVAAVSDARTLCAADPIQGLEQLCSHACMAVRRVITLYTLACDAPAGTLLAEVGAEHHHPLTDAVNGLSIFWQTPAKDAVVRPKSVCLDARAPEPALASCWHELAFKFGNGALDCIDDPDRKDSPHRTAAEYVEGMDRHARPGRDVRYCLTELSSRIECENKTARDRLRREEPISRGSNGKGKKQARKSKGLNEASLVSGSQQEPVKRAADPFSFKEWGLGFEAEHARWHVFRATRSGWVHGKNRMRISKGVQNLLLLELLQGYGAVSKSAAIKILRDHGSNSTHLKVHISRLRNRIRAAVGASKEDDPFQKPDRKTPSFVLRLQIGQAVRDNDARVSDNPSLRFEPCV